MKTYLFTIFLAITACFIGASAQDDTVGLRKRYLTLRNTDAHVTRKTDWEQMGQELETSARAGNPVLYLEVGRLYASMYRALHDDSFFERAEQGYAAVITSGAVSRATRAQAALERCGLLESVAVAEKCLEEVIKDFHGEEAALIATGKLRRVTARIQGDDIEVPTEAPVVLLDAGHGGEDFGAVGVAGLLEKDVTLLLARRVQVILRQEHKLDARLSRKKDEFLPLQRRTELANDSKAVAFVSIHANASPKKTSAGLEVYYLDNAGDDASRLLADRENASGGVSDDLGFIMSDLIQNAKVPASIKFAQVIEQDMVKAAKKHGMVLKSNGVRKAPFYVLVGAHMPCVLVETAYIDNPHDGERLAQAKFREMLAHGIANGVVNFLKGNS